VARYGVFLPLLVASPPMDPAIHVQIVMMVTDWYPGYT
jgi:hypothetical protein